MKILSWKTIACITIIRLPKFGGAFGKVLEDLWKSLKSGSLSLLENYLPTPQTHVQPVPSIYTTRSGASVIGRSIDFRSCPAEG